MQSDLQPVIKKTTLNITLIGYNESSSAEFINNLEALLKSIELEITKEFNFIFKRLAHPLEKNNTFSADMVTDIIPEVIFKEDQLGISFKYDDFEKRLFLNLEKEENLKPFLFICKKVIEEQSNQLKAMGFNFTTIYEKNSNGQLFDDIKNKISNKVTPSEKLRVSSVIFDYQENDYKKKFSVLVNDEGDFIVSVNCHFERFKNTLSRSKIRQTVIEELDNSFLSLFEEFKKTSLEIVKL